MFPPARSCVLLGVTTLSFLSFHVPWRADAKVMEIPIENIKSASDVAGVLGKPPPAEDAPSGFSWSTYGGALNISTNVLFPLEGQEVPPTFEVMPEISATPLGAFQERYREWGFHCVELDGEPPACWPVLGEQPLPRFASVKPGPHTLRVAVTDPTGSWILVSSWSAARHFLVVDPDEADAKAVANQEDAPDPEDGSDGDGTPVQLAVPHVRIATPPEMSIITTRFLDMTYEVATSEPEGFEEHFRHAFCCASLDGGAHACWPLFHVARSPRWVGVGEGFHALAASASHPNTGEEIAESKSATRAFLVYVSGSDEFGGGKAGGAGGFARLGHAGTVSGGGGGSGGSGSGGSYAGGGGGGGGGSFGHSTNDFDPPPGFVVLDIDMSDPPPAPSVVTHKFPIQRHADFRYAAERFCSARGVGNAECADAIVRRIHDSFKASDEQHAKQAEARRAALEHQAEESSRRFPVPEGADGVVVVPRLGHGCRDVERAMTDAVATCTEEHKHGETMGLECLTAQSSLFGMREHGGCMRDDPGKQEALLDFIGNLGAGFGF